MTKALETAGFVDFLSNKTATFTVFAPTDAAFTQLAVDLGFTGDTNDEDAVFAALVDSLTELGGGDPIPLLNDILLTHVTNGDKTASDLDQSGLLIPISGTRIEIDGTELIDKDPGIANPNIVIPNIEVANGLVRAIDRVILPVNITGAAEQDDATSAFELAQQTPELSILVRALEAAKFDGLLDTDGIDLTVFAPTNAAFAQLAVDLGFTGDTSNEDAVFNGLVEILTVLGDGNPFAPLTQILQYHVAVGDKTLDQLKDNGGAINSTIVITAANGATIKVNGTELIDNEPDLQNPNVVIPDLAVSTGVVQVIDRVLLPIDLPALGADMVDETPMPEPQPEPETPFDPAPPAADNDDLPTVAGLALDTPELSLLVRALETAGLQVSWIIPMPI